MVLGVEALLVLLLFTFPPPPPPPRRCNDMGDKISGEKRGFGGKKASYLLEGGVSI